MALSGKSGISGGVDIRGTDVGEKVFTATTTAAAQVQLGGGAVGQALFATATTAAAQNALGGSTIGKGLFEAATTAAAQTLLNQGTVQFSKLTVSAAISAGSVSLPANAYLAKIVVTERGGNAITGGLAFGETAGSGTIVSAHAVGANANTVVTDAALLKKFFSVAAAQTVNFDAVTAWNGANINIVVVYGQL